MKLILATMVVLSLGLLLAHTQQTQPTRNKQQKIENAMQAAPADLSKRATIVDHDGTVLREGSNGWICLPDIPDTPANDPICSDSVGQKWVEAWVNQTAPPQRGTPGISYMLLGGAHASNDDPSIKQPADGKWNNEPPHLMLWGFDFDEKTYGSKMGEGGTPWIMWSGTKYEHLMVPVGGHGATSSGHGQ